MILFKHLREVNSPKPVWHTNHWTWYHKGCYRRLRKITKLTTSKDTENFYEFSSSGYLSSLMEQSIYITFKVHLVNYKHYQREKSKNQRTITIFEMLFGESFHLKKSLLCQNKFKQIFMIGLTLMKCHYFYINVKIKLE